MQTLINKIIMYSLYNSNILEYLIFVIIEHVRIHHTYFPVKLFCLLPQTHILSVLSQSNIIIIIIIIILIHSLLP